MHSKNSNTNLAPRGNLNNLANVEPIFTGVRGALLKPVKAMDGTNLSKNANVIIQPLNLHKPNEKPRFKLTPFISNKESADSNLPESQRNVKTGKSYEVIIENPKNYLKFDKEYFRESEDDLFPTVDSPSIEEVQQSRIPSCFLLSAIQAIVSRPEGRAFIRGMMRQNNDGTTTVRLYDKVKNVFEYVTVKNSIISDKLGTLNAHPALWVHVLENAYAAHGKNMEKEVDQSFSSVYSDGGNAKKAFEVLTGLSSEKLINTSFNIIPLFFKHFLSLSYSLTYENLKDLISTNNPERQTIGAFAMLRREQSQALYELFDAHDENSKFQAIKDYINLFKLHLAHPEKFEEAIRSCSTKTLSAIKPKSEELANAINILNRLFELHSPAQAFTGHYKEHQLEVYDQLKNSLEENKLITASGQRKIETTPGIHGDHSYTVLGVFEKEIAIKDKNGEHKTVPIKFVTLRNPWGEAPGSGRVYHQHLEDLSIKGSAFREPEFWVELNEFCANYHGCIITDSVSERFAQDQERENYIAETTQFINDFSIQFDSSTADLIQARNEYDINIQKLIQAELLEIQKIDKTCLPEIYNIFEADMEEEAKFKGIISVFDEEKFPEMANDKAKKHLYALLKLQWLEEKRMVKHQEEDIDIKFNQEEEALRNSLLDTIQQNACRPDLWEGLSHINSIINIIALTRLKHKENEVSNMLDLSAVLEQDFIFLGKVVQTSSFTSLMLQQKTIEAFVKKISDSLTTLKSFVVQLKDLHFMAEKFGYNINKTNFEKISKKVNEFSENIDQIIKEYPKFASLSGLCSNISENAKKLYQKKEISTEEKEDIERVLQNVFTGELSAVAKRLTTPQRTPKTQALGNEMLKANSLVTKIKNWCVKVRNFFKSVTNVIGTLFHRTDRYELPSLEKRKQINLRK